MTAVCGGGASELKPGVQQNVVFDAALITAGLELISPWLTPFAALIDSFVWQAVSECGTDPPAMPTFDATDVTNLIGGVLNPNLETTLTKVNNALLNYAWYQFCQCSTAPTPAMPVVVAPPGVTTTSSSSQAPCFTGSYTANPPHNWVLGAQSYGSLKNITTLLVPTNGQTHTLTDSFSRPYTIFGIPAGVTAIAYQNKHGGAVNQEPCCASNWLSINYYDVNFNPISTSFNNLEGSPFQNCQSSGSNTISTNPKWWAVFENFIGGTAGDATGEWSVATQVFCGGGPNTLAGCCPPDPGVMEALKQILSLLQTTYSTMPVRVPNYAAGLSHAGLSGLGTVSLASTTIAIRVTATTLPRVYGELQSLPLTYFDIGWVTPVTNEGPEAGIQLTRATQIVPLPEATSSIDYSLPPGAVITIDELQAG